eukprot:GILJ01010810.1.p1 GENE.GILJ01010810.1~~GILJ01010810.1.p1  ORF type:complete len:138 (-),score=22.14 GILJ01010810.1:295-708(-)
MELLQKAHDLAQQASTETCELQLKLTHVAPRVQMYFSYSLSPAPIFCLGKQAKRKKTAASGVSYVSDTLIENGDSELLAESDRENEDEEDHHDEEETQSDESVNGLDLNRFNGLDHVQEEFQTRWRAKRHKMTPRCT